LFVKKIFFFEDLPYLILFLKTFLIVIQGIEILNLSLFDAYQINLILVKIIIPAWPLSCPTAKTFVYLLIRFSLGNN
jgi:hypothetical protein